MRGLMMNIPMTIASIMQHAWRTSPDVEILSFTVDNHRHRTTYARTFTRAGQLAGALARHGIRPGNRIGTLAWNDYRHLELYYGVAGMGAVTHTINPRLFPEQITYIVNHAGDRLLFVDPLVFPMLEKIAASMPAVEKIVVLTDAKHMPDSSLANLQDYESFIAAESGDFPWPELDEETACSLCYTSGTTGHPKGVLYSHRSMVFHSLAETVPNAFGFSLGDVVMPVVPMFHVNAWGICYAAPMAGSKLVFPGPRMGDGETLQALIEEESVTFSAGVPTVWMALLDHLRTTGKRVESLRRVIIGGSACPWAIMEEFEREHGVMVHHAWGMTEMSPLGTVNTLLPGMEKLTPEEQKTMRVKQGRALYGVQMKIVDEADNELPRDGKSVGLLKVRGPCVCREYFKPDEVDEVHDGKGWFATGDMGHIDANGYLQLTDRSKDVIKSGGEWISSIDLENAAVGHPAVTEAAVIAVPHPKWSERPLLVIVKRDGAEVSADEILDYLKDKVAKWWLPDAVEFVDEIPHTATGKIQKLELRQQFRDFRLPD